jgi:uncharacterized protein YceK
MRKGKGVLLFITLTLCILLTGCSTFSGKPESEESVKQKVVTYLLSKGYKEEDFNVNVKYYKIGEGKFGGPYAINVVFNDEPNVTYNYKYNYKSESKDITQNGISTMKDKEDKNFKHAE